MLLALSAVMAESAAPSASAVGSATRPVSRSRTISSTPPESVVVTTGLPAANASIVT